MSSPVDHDRDERSMYVPPWAREAATQPATDGPFDTVAATVERLRRERRQVPRERHPSEPEGMMSQPQFSPQEQEPAQLDAVRPGRRPSPQAVSATPRDASREVDIEAALGEMVRETWRPASLEPVAMPPPQPAIVRTTWGMVARLGSAIGFAAVIALFMVGAIPWPSLTLPFLVDREASAASAVQAVSFKSAAPVAVAMTTSLPIAAPSSPPEPQAPVAAVPAFAPTAAVASVGPPIIQPSIAPQAPALAPPPPSQATTPELRPAMAPDEIALLLQRGRDLVSQGDLAGGRLLLTRAADAGDAEAALILAGTYDSAMLARLKVIGVAPDNARAKAWYIKAAALGSVEAARRLEQYARRD